MCVCASVDLSVVLNVCTCPCVHTSNWQRSIFFFNHEVTHCSVFFLPLLYGCAEIDFHKSVRSKELTLSEKRRSLPPPPPPPTGTKKNSVDSAITSATQMLTATASALNSSKPSISSPKMEAKSTDSSSARPVRVPSLASLDSTGSATTVNNRHSVAGLPPSLPSTFNGASTTLPRSRARAASSDRFYPPPTAASHHHHHQAPPPPKDTTNANNGGANQFSDSRSSSSSNGSQLQSQPLQPPATTTTFSYVVSEEDARRAINPALLVNQSPRSVHTDLYDTAFALQALNHNSCNDYLTRVRGLWDGHLMNNKGHQGLAAAATTESSVATADNEPETVY